MRHLWTAGLVMWALAVPAQTTSWSPTSIAIVPQEVRVGEGVSVFIPNAAGRELDIDFNGPDGLTYSVRVAFDAIGHASVDVPAELVPGGWRVSSIRAQGSAAFAVHPIVGALMVSDSAPSCIANLGFAVDELSEADQHTVRAGLLLGTRYLCDRGLVQMPRAHVQVDSTAEFPTASASGNAITVYKNSRSWIGASGPSKAKILAHEYVHVVQNATSALRTSAWLREGAAEYLAYRAVDAAGLIPYPTAMAQQLSGLQRLSGTLENPGDSREEPVYAMWHLAVDLLSEARSPTQSDSRPDYTVGAPDGRIGRWIYGPGDLLLRYGFGPASADVFIRQWRNGLDAGLLGPVARTDSAGKWSIALPLSDDPGRGRWYEQAVYRSSSVTAQSAFSRYEVSSARDEQPTGVDLLMAFQNSLRTSGSWESAFQQYFHLTPSEFNDQFEHFRRAATTRNETTLLTISLWGRFAPGALGEGTPATSTPYVFRITGVNLTSMSTDEKAAAFIRPPNTGWGGTRLGADLLVIYFPQGYAPGIYTAGFHLPDGRRATTSFEFSPEAGTNAVPAVTGTQPEQLHQGQPGTAIVLKGTGFTPRTTVSWDGMSRSARLIDSGQLVITVSGADLTAGEHVLTVWNPSPGGGRSAPYRIDVRPN